MAYKLKTLKQEYKAAIDSEDYDTITFLISQSFWQIKKVKKAFEKYIKNWRNPNFYDTQLYEYLKPSEQANVEMEWMDDVLTGVISI